MSDSPRRKARELVLQGLYACEISENNPEEILNKITGGTELSTKTLEFANSLICLVVKNQRWADDQITELATNWDINRIADIDRIILRIALVELHEVPDTPMKVAINEAIELAKKFSTKESSSFINGLLDRYAKDHQE